MNLSSDDRQRLKAAVMLQGTYDRDQVASTFHQLPNERWQQLQRIERQVRMAENRGYRGAAQNYRQRLNDQIRFCVQELNQYETQVSQALKPRSKPSLRLLYEELQALADDFLEVDVDRVLKELVVCTERITLEEIDLGRFEIRLSLKGNGVPDTYRVIALDPNPASRDDNVPHPHIQGESLCTGDGTQAINNALATGRLSDFFLTIRQILETYNSSSAYVSLEDWNGLSCGDCGDCGDTMDSDDSYCCEQCERQLCESCTRSCNDCHVSQCHECSDNCPKCEETYCRSCLQSCEMCDDSMCSSCLDDELCETCHALQQEDDDAESEDTPTDQTTPPPTTQETTTQITPSHTAIQSVCVGEALVPA